MNEISNNPSWEDIESYTRALAELIDKSKFQPDYLIGISRGGWVPAVLLSHLMRWVPFASIDVKKEGDKRKVDENSHLNLKILKNKRILLVEDMLETGLSAQVAREFLETEGEIVRLACYFTRDNSLIKPDFVLVEGVSHEIVFPWEKFRG